MLDADALPDDALAWLAGLLGHRLRGRDGRRPAACPAAGGAGAVPVRGTLAGVLRHARGGARGDRLDRGARHGPTVGSGRQCPPRLPARVRPLPGAGPARDLPAGRLPARVGRATPTTTRSCTAPPGSASTSRPAPTPRSWRGCSQPDAGARGRRRGGRAAGLHGDGAAARRGHGAHAAHAHGGRRGGARARRRGGAGLAGDGHRARPVVGRPVARSAGGPGGRPGAGND